MKIWTMCSHYTIKEKSTWTKYQTTCKFFSFYLFRSSVKTKWAGLFLCAVLALAVWTKELLHHCSEKLLKSFPERWLFPLLHELSLSLWPYSMPFIALFSFCCHLPWVREGRGSSGWVISPKGSDGIKISPQWIISPKRIRWHNMIQSCQFTTPKPACSQLKATWAVLAGHYPFTSKDHLPVKS